MDIKSTDLTRLVGLAARNRKPGAAEPVLLTGAATDPETGLIVSLASSAKYDDKGNYSNIKMKYWRQLPYGDSQS